MSHEKPQRSNVLIWFVIVTIVAWTIGVYVGINIPSDYFQRFDKGETEEHHTWIYANITRIEEAKGDYLYTCEILFIHDEANDFTSIYEGTRLGVQFSRQSSYVKFEIGDIVKIRADKIYDVSGNTYDGRYVQLFKVR